MPVRVLDSLMESYGIKGIDGTRASHGAKLKRTVIVIYPSCSKRLHKPDAGKAKTKAGAAPRSVGYSVDPG